eukprot:1137298-Pelagomonas_calceolata.AAC.4
MTVLKQAEFLHVCRHICLPGEAACACLIVWHWQEPSAYWFMCAQAESLHAASEEAQQASRAAAAAQAAAASKQAALQQALLLQQQQHGAMSINPQWLAEMSGLPVSLLQQHQGPGLYNPHLLPDFSSQQQQAVDANAQITLAAAYARQLGAGVPGALAGKVCMQQQQQQLPYLHAQQQQPQQCSGDGSVGGNLSSSHHLPDSQQSDYDCVMDGQAGGSCSGGRHIASDLYS